MIDLCPHSKRFLPRLLAAFTVLVSLGPFGLAQDLGRARNLPLELRVETFQLSNGWRFLLLARHDAPVISFETRVDTGSRHDPHDAHGLANLMKVMLFKGSDRIGTRDWALEQTALLEVDDAMQAWLALRDEDEPAPESMEHEAAVTAALARLEKARKVATALADSEEFSRLLESAGGAETLNAFLSADATSFVVSLPANQLELWCWLESERFARPVLREFYSTRDALAEDQRSHLATYPTSALEELLLATSYSSHPYRYAPLGCSDDLSRLTRGAAKAFLASNYGARRITTAIVGDFDVTAIAGLLERYFDALPAGRAQSLQVQVAEEPVQDRERRVEVELDAPPEIRIAWHVPRFAHADAPAVRIALLLLGSARSSRLERRLIRDDGTASEITVTPTLGGDELRGLAMIRAVPITGVETIVLERSIYAEIERLAAEGPSEQELFGVKRAANAEYLRGLRDNASVASGLLEHDDKGGDWRGLFHVMDHLEEVQAEDVMRVLRTYFTEARRTVLTLSPPAGALTPEELK